MRRVSLAILTTLAVTGCGPSGPTEGQSVDRLPLAPYGDVETLVRDLYIPGADSNAFAAPTSAELASFDGALDLIDRRAFDEAASRASALGYDLWHLADPRAPALVALVERSAHARGRGTFVLDTGATSTRVVEVPHPLADAATLEEGAALFVGLRAGALLVGGTHRCADLASTSCLGSEATNACAGRLRISDAAHFTESFFQRAHAALFRLWPDSVAVSLHAHADVAGQPDVIVSAGTRDALEATAPVNQLRDGLRASGLSVASCNATADPTPRLCGESNVQGRSSNGSSDACLRDAASAGGRFLHVEQGAAVLVNPSALAGVLAARL
ncbi:MAG: hypothetical protein JWM82_320 [Myxococcales bacterium]|nr:hypothetical protein [Myxococcales bacterium]